MQNDIIIITFELNHSLKTVLKTLHRTLTSIVSDLQTAFIISLHVTYCTFMPFV